MSEHTPGPWTVFADVNIRDGKDGRRGIATTGGTVDGWVPDQGLAENLANACLIAAAPELLEALDRLTGEVSGSWGAFQGELRQVLGNTNYQIIVDRLTAAYAAIAKATGTLDPKNAA